MGGRCLALAGASHPFTEPFIMQPQGRPLDEQTPWCRRTLRSLEQWLLMPMKVSRTARPVYSLENSDNLFNPDFHFPSVLLMW